MEKKAKVTKITKMDKKDNYGNTSFIVEFENGDKGFYVSKNENQSVFVVGQDANYLIETKLGNSGKEYFKVSTPQKPFTPNNGGAKYTPQDPKTQMISFALSYSKDCYVANINNGKNVGEDFIFSIADRMVKWLKENSN